MGATWVSHGRAFQTYAEELINAYAETSDVLQIQSYLYLGDDPLPYARTLDDQMRRLDMIDPNMFQAYMEVTTLWLKRTGTERAQGGLLFTGAMLVKAFKFSGRQKDADAQERLWGLLRRYFSGMSGWEHLAEL
jgi:hypothetical protein